MDGLKSTLGATKSRGSRGDFSTLRASPPRPFFFVRHGIRGTMRSTAWKFAGWPPHEEKNSLSMVLLLLRARDEDPSWLFLFFFWRRWRKRERRDREISPAVRRWPRGGMNANKFSMDSSWASNIRYGATLGRRRRLRSHVGAIHLEESFLPARKRGHSRDEGESWNGIDGASRERKSKETQNIAWITVTFR